MTSWKRSKAEESRPLGTALKYRSGEPAAGQRSFEKQDIERRSTAEQYFSSLYSQGKQNRVSDARSKAVVQTASTLARDPPPARSQTPDRAKQKQGAR